MGKACALRYATRLRAAVFPEPMRKDREISPDADTIRHFARSQPYERQTKNLHFLSPFIVQNKGEAATQFGSTRNERAQHTKLHNSTEFQFYLILLKQRTLSETYLSWAIGGRRA